MNSKSSVIMYARNFVMSVLAAMTALAAALFGTLTFRITLNVSSVSLSIFVSEIHVPIRKYLNFKTKYQNKVAVKIE